VHQCLSRGAPLTARRSQGTYGGSFALLIVVLATPRAAAGSEAARVVKGIAWETVSPEVRAVIGGLSAGAVGEPQAPAPESPSTRSGWLFLDGSAPEGWEAGSTTELIARLDDRRATMLDVRHSRAVRGEALQELAALSLELYKRDCCRPGALDPWSDALEELEGGDVAARVERLVERHPALRDLEAAFFPEAPKPAESGISPCRSLRAAPGCAAEDLALAGFRLALLLEEALSSCRRDPGGTVVCLPYAGRATSSCLRALPLTWGSGPG